MAIQSIVAEHETHLRNALVPAASEAKELSGVLRFLVKDAPIVGARDQARVLRTQTFRLVLEEMLNEGSISRQSHLQISCVADPVFCRELR